MLGNKVQIQLLKNGLKVSSFNGKPQIKKELGNFILNLDFSGWVGLAVGEDGNKANSVPGLYCQNPNLTTTQPNLNIGLGLT